MTHQTPRSQTVYHLPSPNWEVRAPDSEGVRVVLFCVLDKNGRIVTSSLLAKTAVGVLVMSGTSPGILIALQLGGKTPAALKPDIIVSGTIAILHTFEKSGQIDLYPLLRNYDIWGK